MTAAARENMDLEVIPELAVDCAVESLLPDEAALLEQRLAIEALRQKAPKATPDAIVGALRSTEPPCRDPKSGVTTPRMDERSALSALRKGGPCRTAQPPSRGGRRGGPRGIRQAPRPDAGSEHTVDIMAQTTPIDGYGDPAHA
ncbi:MAG: hypothetical protein P8R42_20915 [Candidatus Binatia bacterium]|nr:hypothetical protein [Candidatus Binatia bacterium]